MTNHQESLLAGLIITVLLVWMSVVFWKWAFRRAQNLKESRIAKKVRSSAQNAIAQSFEGIASAAKASATFARKVTKENPNSRYDALLKIKHLLDAGALTPEEYEAEKRKLIA